MQSYFFSKSKKKDKRIPHPKIKNLCLEGQIGIYTVAKK
jgi:hypothetical protein